MLCYVFGICGRYGIYIRNGFRAVNDAGQSVTVGCNFFYFDGLYLRNGIGRIRAINSARYIAAVSQCYPAVFGLTPKVRRLPRHFAFFCDRDMSAVFITADNFCSRCAGSGSDVGGGVINDPFLAVRQSKFAEIDIVFAEIVKFLITRRNASVIERSRGLIKMLQSDIPITSRVFCRLTHPVITRGLAFVENIADENHRVRVCQALLIAVLNVSVNSLRREIVLSLSAHGRREVIRKFFRLVVGEFSRAPLGRRVHYLRIKSRAENALCIGLRVLRNNKSEQLERKIRMPLQFADAQRAAVIS